MQFDNLSHRVIGCAMEVHRRLGPGLLESIYEHCLAKELELAGMEYKQQLPVPITYRDLSFECGYRIDLLVESSLVIELKSVEQVLPVHEAQLLTYLKLANIKTGLLINFNVKLLKDGLKRMVL